MRPFTFQPARLPAEPSQAGRMDRDLLLRPWVREDAPALRAAIDEDVDHIRPWLTWSLEEPATLERTLERIDGWIEQVRSGKARRYAVAPVAEPATILGGANLYTRAEPSERGVGYWLRRSATGQGIADAAVAALVIAAFREPRVDRIVIECDVANEASARFAERLGFAPAGRAERRYPDGSPRTLRVFGMSRDVYAEQAAEMAGRARRIGVLRS